MMRMNSSARSQRSSDSPVLAQITEKCPCTPAAPAGLHGHTFKPDQATLIFAAIMSHPEQRPQTEVRRRISFDRSRQKRGPPSLILL